MRTARTRTETRARLRISPAACSAHPLAATRNWSRCFKHLLSWPSLSEDIPRRREGFSDPSLFYSMGRGGEWACGGHEARTKCSGCKAVSVVAARSLRSAQGFLVGVAILLSRWPLSRSARSPSHQPYLVFTTKVCRKRTRRRRCRRWVAVCIPRWAARRRAQASIDRRRGRAVEAFCGGFRCSLARRISSGDPFSRSRLCGALPQHLKSRFSDWPQSKYISLSWQIDACG
ncbi:hypothetical protein HMN09_00001700 [Mycena chlorophos]|uniref:Uncharacterized protein n=1 Tax=Mycena chlorophos TaxID=658473 RepID=A0A8H6TR63_MYCCL|nr:hypothetical protein HMN09_00001700 [Mycena chlorophos]